LTGSLIFLVGAILSDTANSIYAVLMIAVSYPVHLLVKNSAITEASDDKIDTE
jgi:hypothetical protein